MNTYTLNNVDNIINELINIQHKLSIDTKIIAEMSVGSYMSIMNYNTLQKYDTQLALNNVNADELYKVGFIGNIDVYVNPSMHINDKTIIIKY